MSLSISWPRRASTALALFVVPFLILAPHGLLDSFRAQAARSLQVESLGGAALARFYRSREETTPPLSAEERRRLAALLGEGTER